MSDIMSLQQEMVDLIENLSITSARVRLVGKKPFINDVERLEQARKDLLNFIKEHMEFKA